MYVSSNSDLYVYYVLYGCIKQCNCFKKHLRHLYLSQTEWLVEERAGDLISGLSEFILDWVYDGLNMFDAWRDLLKLLRLGMDFIFMSKKFQQ